MHAVTISIGCCQGDSGGLAHVYAITTSIGCCQGDTCMQQRFPLVVVRVTRACNNDFHWLLPG